MKAANDPEPGDAAKLEAMVEGITDLRQALGARAAWILTDQERLQARAPGAIHTQERAAAARAATAELEFVIAHLARWSKPPPTRETREG